MYETPVTPYKHQEDALKRSWNKEYFALLMAMRTGKTKVTLDSFGMLEHKKMADDILVIAPAGVYRTWSEAIAEHLAPSLLKRLDVHVWSADDKSQAKLNRFDQFINHHKGPRALIIDVEALSSVSRLKQSVLDFVKDRKVLGVIDESVTVKNPDSKRSAFLLDKLRERLAYRRILSGLPAPNSPFDLWAQFFFLDPNILGESYVNYRAQYADIERVCMEPNAKLIGMLEKRAGTRIEVQGVGRVNVEDLPRQLILKELEARNVYVKSIPIVKQYKNEDRLAAIIKPHSFRVRLEDCYDMPAKVYMRREVKLTEEQRRVYHELRRNAMAELESKDFVTASMVIVRLLRMHQVLCGHVKDEEGKLHEVPENRTKEALAQLEDFDGKAIIWACYDHSIRKITQSLIKEYGEGSVARFWGGNVSTREAEEKRFKSDQKCRFMVATASAGGRGRTWTAATLMIFHSCTNNLDHRLQSEERAEGVGKKIPTAIVDLVAPETVDEKIIKALRSKLDIASAIQGDDYKKWLI